jgi:hypothetical protein
LKTLTLSQQKVLKSLHLISASLWLSCVVILMLLPILTHKITSGDGLYIYNLVYHFIDIFLLTPVAIITLCTGLIYSLCTKWGFFQHGWIICKWIITLVIIITGIFYLGPMVGKMLEISDVKRLAAFQDQYYLHGETIGLYAAIINSVLLILAVIFSVYKPWRNIRR